jgi:hypothetical protein
VLNNISVIEPNSFLGNIQRWDVHDFVRVQVGKKLVPILHGEANPERSWCLSLINKERGQAVPQIMETEALSRPEHNPSRDSSGTVAIWQRSSRPATWPMTLKTLRISESSKEIWFFL